MRVVAAREVEAYGADHRRAGPGHVDPADHEPPSGDLGQQGVDAVPRGDRLVERVGVARGRGVGEPAHQQSGRLQAGEDLVGSRVVGQVGSGGGAHDLLGRQAQEEVTLSGLEGREHLGRHPVGDRGRAGRVAASGGDGVG